MSIQRRTAGPAVTVVGVLAAALVAMVAAVLTSPAHHSRAASGHLNTPRANTPRAVNAVLPSTPRTYIGVYERGLKKSYGPVETYARAIGRQPNLVLYFTDWGGGFQASLASIAHEHGATLLLDLDPTRISLLSIANGQQDRYLKSFAESVLAFGNPVIISFGHEMNGTWYPWGWTHASPHLFVRAWRHVVSVFRKVGAGNVTWLWTVNGITAGEAPIRQWWPGAAYVTWVGVDGYYYQPGDTFASIFGPTLAAVRTFTRKPILISETAAGQVAGPAQKIPDLFAGVRQSGLLGFVWFDVAQHDGLYHQDWRLEDHKAASAVFRRAVRTYMK